MNGAMFEVRLHGRGGQGVVTAAELMSVAAFYDGHEAQAFPSFGSERMGAPIISFCRVSDTAIRLREPVAAPDAVIVGDATLLHHVDVFAGLAPDGYVIINSARTLEQLGLGDLFARHDRSRLVAINASELSRVHTGRALPNVCLLGAFAALTGNVTLEGIERATADRFAPAVACSNVTAARAAFREINRRLEDVDA